MNNMNKPKRVPDALRIVRRECDRAMAEKKGYLPCEQKCKTCHACIEVFSSGEKRHFAPTRGYE